MNQKPQGNRPDAAGKLKGKNSADAADRQANDADLDYISTWDAICYDPADAFMHGAESPFEDGSYDVGEDYPRGV